MIKYIAFLFYGKYLQLQYYINFSLLQWMWECVLK